jgi:excisionase family DNA binding protein
MGNYVFREPGEKPRAPAAELMRKGEVAAYLRVSESTVDRMRERGEIPAYRVGVQLRFKRSDMARVLDRLLEQRGKQHVSDASLS